MPLCRVCYEPFTPPPSKPRSAWCNWTCRFLADPEAALREVKDATRQAKVVKLPRPVAPISANVWRGMLQLAHPDKRQQVPAMQAVAEAVTKWLLAHRPPAVRR